MVLAAYRFRALAFSHSSSSSPPPPPRLYTAQTTSKHYAGFRAIFFGFRALFFAFCWLFVKLVVEPMEALMRANGWRAELTLTARLTFSTAERGESFNRAIPLRARFPRGQNFSARTVEEQLVEMDVAERV
ncbi:hypothetical protein EI94DRAFT_1813590 [Lactarius quietus]|nr:hypothetical protein EI94DRAFT_1813590 [Lactarius quietus]